MANPGILLWQHSQHCFEPHSELCKLHKNTQGTKHLSNEKKPGCLGYKGDYSYISSSVGIIINQCKGIAITQPDSMKRKARLFSWLTGGT